MRTEAPATKLETCFIAAPIRTDTTALRTALENRRIDWTDAVAATPGSSFFDTIQAAIESSDFVCAVLSADAENGSVFFEMGLARGLDRPLLVFAEEGAAVPADLEGVAYARTNLKQSEAINFHLDAFLHHTKRTSQPERIRSTSRRSRNIDVGWALEALDRLSKDSPQQRAFKLEHLVAKLFEVAGAVVSTRPEPDHGVDMAVWIDDLQSTIGNPLLVEVKAGNLTESRLSLAERQIQSFLSRVPARAGLIVYQGQASQRLSFRRFTSPYIWCFSVKELIEIISKGQLAAEIIRRRNEAVHRKY